MNMVRACCGGLILIVLAGCATPMPRTVSVVPTEGIETFFSGGNSCGAVHLDRGEEAIVRVAICAQPVDTKRARLNVGVWNDSPHPVTLIDTGITASMADRPLRMIRYAELVAEEKNRQMWAAIGAGLAAGASAYNASQAGYSTTSGTVSGSYSGYGARSGYERGTLSGSYSERTYDAGAASRAQAHSNAQNLQMFDRLRADAANNSATIEDIALRSETVEPGGNIFSALFFELPPKSGDGGQAVQVKVAVDGSTIAVPLVVGD